MDEGTPALPVHLLTGFLGSGKTTLLRRLLRDPALHDTAVLINEFGEVGLDHHLIEAIDETTVLLPSGCLCCTVRGELADAIRHLLARRASGSVPPFARLIIESSGLADPFPVLSTLKGDAVLRHHVRLGTVVTTVDAVLGSIQRASQPEWIKQVAAADRLVLTKTDLAKPTVIAALHAELVALNPTAQIGIDGTAALFDGDAFALGAPGSAAAGWFNRALNAEGQGRRLAHRHDDGPRGASSFALTLHQPLDWTAFGVWLTALLHCHGAAILRVKGLLWVVGSDTPVALHGVQHLIHTPTHLGGWPDEDRASRLVFITRGLDPALIERSLHAFGVLAAEA